MKFFGDGSKLIESREQKKETIDAAKTKFHHGLVPVKPTTGTISIFGTKTLKQEKEEFGKKLLKHTKKLMKKSTEINQRKLKWVQLEIQKWMLAKQGLNKN